MKKGAITASGAEEKGFVSNVFLVPKSEGRWRLILNLKALNQFVIHEHFKMEDIRCVKDLLNWGDYMCKLDLKDAYLSIPIQQSFRKFLKFSWQGKMHEYTALPFGLSAAPRVFTKLLKPILATLRQRGIRLIAYLDDFLIVGKSKKETEEAFQETKALMGESWLHDKRGQMSEQSISGDRVPWVLSRFKAHDVQDDLCTREANQGEVQAGLGEQSDHSQGISTHSGCVSSYSISSLACSPALQSFAVSEERRNPPPLIQYDSDSEYSEPGGSPVVDKPFEPSQWQTDSSSTSRHCDRIGCFQYRLGSMLQGHKDERLVVQGGVVSSHQLQGDVGSISCIAVIREGHAGSSCQTQGGQHNNDVLHQPHGRHTLPSTDEIDFTDMDMVPGQKGDFVSRSGVQNAGRQLGMEIESGHLQPFDEAAWTMFSGSVRVSANDSIGSVHELEAGPRGSCNGCPVTTVDTHRGLCFPSIFTHRMMPDQGTSGEGIEVGTNSTNVANTAMVSGTAIDGNQRANSDSIISRSATEPQRRSSSSNNSRITESSRIVSVRKSLSNEGISEGATNLILASWRSNTEQSYSCSWRKWESWCAENGHEAINSPLRGILDFLASQYEQGKQYRTINSYRSAISMTHTPIEGVVVGKHPLVSRLMKAYIIKDHLSQDIRLHGTFK